MDKPFIRLYTDESTVRLLEHRGAFSLLVYIALQYTRQKERPVKLCISRVKLAKSLGLTKPELVAAMVYLRDGEYVTFSRPDHRHDRAKLIDFTILDIMGGPVDV